MSVYSEKYGVIFDLDGTMWDSSLQVGIAWQEVFDRYEVGIPVTKERMAVMMGRTIPESRTLSSGALE